MKISQVVALERDLKARFQELFGELTSASGQPALFQGHRKRYQPLDDQGERLPEERKPIQQRVDYNIERLSEHWAKLVNNAATRDAGNAEEKASVVLADDVFMDDAPPTFLLFLEKQLQSLYEWVKALPELDQGDTWEKDDSTGLSRTHEIQTHRTRKTPRVIVKYDATKEHPAQTELVHEDQIVGHFFTTRISGAISHMDKKGYIDRIVTLHEAVKLAREEVNAKNTEVVKGLGEKILKYVFGN
jgi:hypothetical protein